MDAANLGDDMNRFTKCALSLGCLAVLLGASDAFAAHRKHAQRHHGHYYYVGDAAGRGPLVIERRSFLNPGTVVRTGARHRYMLEQTFFNQDPVEAYQRSWHMQETLPKRFNQPWSPGQIQFW